MTRSHTRLRTAIHAVLWIVVALPAAYQIYTLGAAISHRIAYPYDLEWMEGGLLVHAQRIRDGLGIYVPPSKDFIPYLYTPLYPTLLALFGPSYVLGRVISVIALVGIFGVTGASIASRRNRHAAWGPVWAGVILALGLFAAVYPFTKAWYDLVRADTVFLAMVTAGIAGLARWGRTGSGLTGHAKVGAGAAVLALAFFCKQTGIIYVAFGGLIVLVLAWRRAITYVAVAGAIGLGFVALFGAVTKGWFWIYVSKIHRAHDFNMVRFWGAFGKILWHFPSMTIAIGVALVIMVATWIRRRAFPQQAAPLALWSATFGVSTLVGALGIGTEWSVENAYIPAFLHGAIAAGAAVPAVAGCLKLLVEDRHAACDGDAAEPRRFQWIDLLPTAGAIAVAIALAIPCANARWNWRAFIPTRSDMTAGDALVARIRAVDGAVWFPSHPWYVHLAGKTPYVHRMGVKDVTAREPRPILALDNAIDKHAFAAIVLDNVDLHNDLQAELSALRFRLRREYHPSLLLPAEERPRGYSGSNVVPESIWVPSLPARAPTGASVVFDFEITSWNGWERSGTAWGNGPVADILDDHHVIVAGTGGHRFATSMTGGHAATGRMTSPLFALDGAKLTLGLGGGVDATKLRVELWVDAAIVATVGVTTPGGDQLRPATLEIPAAVRGKQGKLVLIDDSPTQHLDVDDVWMWAAN